MAEGFGDPEKAFRNPEGSADPHLRTTALGDASFTKLITIA